MATEAHTVDSEVIKAVAQRLLPMLLDQPKPVAECALLLAYCCIADSGATVFSTTTIEQRIAAFLYRGSESLCAILEEVASTPDADIWPYKSNKTH